MLACVVAQAGGTGRGAGRAEALGVGGAEYADAVQPRLERGGELEVAPGRGGVGVQVAQPHAGVGGGVCIELEAAARERDGAEQESMAGEFGVEPLGAFLERGEGHRAGGEADARAQRADVVEVVVETLELERERARDAKVAVGPEPERVLDGVRVGDRVGHRARGARTLRVRERVGDRSPFGGALEPAMLVEQP